MDFHLVVDYFRNLRDCWNCGRKVPKGKKCPHCKALPERPRLYADSPDESPDK